MTTEQDRIDHIEKLLIDKHHGPVLAVNDMIGKTGAIKQSRSTLYKLIDNGEIVPFHLGERTFFYCREVARYIDAKLREQGL
jgi:predicted DNA-binding transcriptional regulator AlpA